MTHIANITPADIDAGIARARQLRSRYLADLAQGFADALTTALIRQYRSREIGRHLEDLPDYLLKDIGIERTQIPAVVAGTLNRPSSSLADAVRRRLGSIFGKQPAVTGGEVNDRRRLAA
jgi:uncharacterized protein YjiS (DUF1127 family)